MKYVYFVSYAHVNDRNGGAFGFGNAEVPLDREIQDIACVSSIASGIAKEFGYFKISVISYQIMRTESAKS